MSYNTSYREIRCTLYSVSSKHNNLQNFCTISQPVCWHSCIQDRVHPHHWGDLHFTHLQPCLPPSPLTPEHLVTTNLLFIFIILPFRECCISGIIKSNLLEVAFFLQWLSLDIHLGPEDICSYKTMHKSL